MAMRKLMTWLLYALVVLVVAVFIAGQAGFLPGKEPSDLRRQGRQAEAPFTHGE
jgi:hypothetical protein